METTVQLLASVVTLASMWAYGSKLTLGPALALVGQVCWWIIMFQGGLWGLLPLNAAMAFIHIRNFLKWRADERHQS
jgi:hypothetical protein